MSGPTVQGGGWVLFCQVNMAVLRSAKRQVRFSFYKKQIMKGLEDCFEGLGLSRIVVLV